MLVSEVQDIYTVQFEKQELDKTKYFLFLFVASFKCAHAHLYMQICQTLNRGQRQKQILDYLT